MSKSQELVKATPELLSEMEQLEIFGGLVSTGDDPNNTRCHVTYTYCLGANCVSDCASNCTSDCALYCAANCTTNCVADCGCAYTGCISPYFSCTNI